MEQNKKATSVICTITKQDKIPENIQNKTFIIPTYQRLYAWKDEQIKALLDDFKNCIEHNNQKNEVKRKSHFIGNIVVSEDDGKYVLIDGQQRLTTIWLALRYLLRKEFFINKANYFDIEMPIREEDIKAINNYCDNEKSLDECFNEKNNTNVGFKNAFKCFEVYFGKDIEEYKQQFIKFIKGQVKFNLVILGDQVELNKYFVRMNNTGVQLDGTDILKARLLKLISDKDKSKVTEYARIFDECSQMNYFADFSKNYENTSGKVPTIENIINNENNLQNYSNNDKDRAEFESIIDFPTFVLHVFKILSRQELKEEPNKKIFKEEAQISIKKDKFLENTWDKLKYGLSAEQAKAIINALREYRIIFDTFVIKRKSDDDENVYRLWNKDRNNNWSEVKDKEENKSSLKNLAIIQNYLRVARRGDNTNYHHFLTHYLEFCKSKDLNQNAKELKDYLKSIDDFLALKQFNMANNLNNTSNLIDEINAINFGDTISIEDNLRDINENKFSFLNYSNRGNHKVNLTYWFHRLEYYLLIGNYYTNQELGADFKEKFEKYKSGYYFRNINSVEHILAQHEEDQNNNKLDNKSDIDLFGNLALISSSENSSLSNQGYEKKRIDFNKNKIISLKLFDVFENKKYKDGDKNQWLSRQIQDHQKAMLEVLQKSFDSQKNLK